MWELFQSGKKGFITVVSVALSGVLPLCAFTGFGGGGGEGEAETERLIG